MNKRTIGSLVIILIGLGIICLGFTILIYRIKTISAGAPSQTTSDGPFGFSWGERKEDIERKGISISQVSIDGDLTILKIEKAPKNLDISEWYFVTIDNEYGLQRITMASKTFKEDASGKEGKRVFSELKQVLTEKYGEPFFGREVNGLKLYQGEDEFYQCLGYDGCGYWNAIYKIDGNVFLFIELNGLSREEGFIKITYHGVHWKICADKIKERQSKANADAL